MRSARPAPVCASSTWSARTPREVEAAWGISDFSARVGINTGETAVGLVGAADPQAVVLGDTPNVAARLQSYTNPGTIAVGETTARALLQRFVLEPLGEVSVKGRVKPVEAWRLVSSQSATQASAPTTPLVGREAEVGRLDAIAKDLTAGRGQIVFLLGDSGIGKTRLLGELHALTEDRVTWMEGRCLSYGTELLYGPFIEMLRSWVGAEEGEAEISVRTKLRAKLGLLPSVEHADVLPYLSRLLSLKLDPETEERLRQLPTHELGAEVPQGVSHVDRERGPPGARRARRRGPPLGRCVDAGARRDPPRARRPHPPAGRVDAASRPGIGGLAAQDRGALELRAPLGRADARAALRRRRLAAPLRAAGKQVPAGHRAAADRERRRGQPAVPRGARERVRGRLTGAPRADMGTDGDRRAGDDRDAREPAARAHRPAPERGPQARSGGRRGRAQLPPPCPSARCRKR